MPYASLAQARKFHADPKLRKYAAEYDAATDFKHLPERAKKKHKHRRSVLHELHRSRR
jgi:hypothetical protein